SYAVAGAYTLSITITDSGGSSATVSSQIGVSSAGNTGVPLSMNEGSSFNGNVAQLAANPGAGATELINWGDGSSSYGQIVLGTGGTPVWVAGAHTFADEGQYLIQVKVTTAAGTVSSVFAIATVNDAPLSAAGTTFTALTNQPYTGAVAIFTDANPSAPASDF